MLPIPILARPWRILRQAGGCLHLPPWMDWSPVHGGRCSHFFGCFHGPLGCVGLGSPLVIWYHSACSEIQSQFSFVQIQTCEFNAPFLQFTELSHLNLHENLPVSPQEFLNWQINGQPHNNSSENGQPNCSPIQSILLMTSLALLPVDILVHNILPQLPAASLIALESTCKWLHNIMCAFVKLVYWIPLFQKLERRSLERPVSNPYQFWICFSIIAIRIWNGWKIASKSWKDGVVENAVCQYLFYTLWNKVVSIVGTWESSWEKRPPSSSKSSCGGQSLW